MSVFGIVSEYNPFHFGHKYLVRCARELGASTVVSVMSGNSTQRGELAIVDKYYRAEGALRSGIDLVLELPYPFSSASAEFFARGAISVLKDICDTVIFGSECGDIELLRSAAEYGATNEFKERYRELLEKGEQSASAYISLMNDKLGISLLSNDILGVEYIKAAAKLGAELEFITVKRIGSGYMTNSVRDDGAPDSAMAIRKMLTENGADVLSKRLPEGSFEALCRAYSLGEYIKSDKYFEAARFYFRLVSPVELSKFVGLDGGLAERICKAANESESGEEFASALPTKRYTDAKLRRSLLFAMTGVTDSDIAALPSYTNLLAANELGRELLSGFRKSGGIRIITKPSDAQELDDEISKRQYELASRLDAIYGFCLYRSKGSGEMMKKKPYIT